MAEERLQKILATAGVASRRKAEVLITEGRVTVNGKVVTELGTKADADRDHIKVDGKLIKQPERFVYLALNKPDNVVSTAEDPQRRATVLDYMAGVRERVYPVGRLDYHSQGLILLTNDGEFANAITSARSHVPKTYLVKANGSLTPEQEEEFRTGVPLSGRRTAPAGLKLYRRADNPWYEVTLIEGRNQQVRIMFKHFGRLVEKLKRVRIGNVVLGSLKPGEFRHLTPDEVRKLMRIASGQVAGENLLRDAKTIAVVGLSNRRSRPSYGVSEYMQANGYRIIPVNPNETQVLGEKAYSSLEEIPEHVDIVDVFRRSECVPEIVDAAIRIGARGVWMQEGVVHQAAAEKARAAGLDVVMDRCILKEHRKMRSM